MSWLRACCLLVLAALTGCAGLGPVSPPAPDSRFRELARLVGTDPESGPGFAAELAAYRADPAYACRRPAFAYYFAHRFGHTLDYRACPATVPFFLLDRDRGGYLVRVAPSRVRRIHIMFATAGDGVASRFGHVSLRLVVCPDVGASDQACDENLLQHVVLGYVARVNEFHLSLVKGVLGGYDAHLSGFSFMEAYRANTLLADRDIYSVPLRLTSEQTEQIVRELSEIHWSFRGDYRFFTNNCATLLQDTLAAALAGAAEPEALAAGYLRPDAFFSALRDSDLVQYDVLNSLTEAERRGYFFRSARPYYQQAFETVRQAPGWSGPDSLQAYLATPARERPAAAAHIGSFADHLCPGPACLGGPGSAGGEGADVTGRCPATLGAGAGRRRGYGGTPGTLRVVPSGPRRPPAAGTVLPSSPGPVPAAIAGIRGYPGAGLP